MAEWSLDSAVITAGGRRMTGFGESDAISYKRANDDWEPVDCCDGATVHNRILSRRGEVTLTLRYDSESNGVLSDLANGRTIESGEARVMKRPEPTYGAKTGDEVWVLSCVPLRVEYERGGA